MPEAELYGPIKLFLEAQGYVVKGEIGACDVMAVKGDEGPVVVEVLAPFAVDQAADLCSCGHENDDSAAGLVCMSWTATGTRTTATWNA